MRKVLFILLTLAIPALLLAAEPVRVWTTKDGQTTQAAFDVARDTDSATVPLTKDGKKYKVPFDKLSKADQDYVTRVRQTGRSINGGRGQNVSRSMQVVPTSRRFALLIGVNEYPEENLLTTLPSAVKDMTDLAAALEKYAGFPRENITLMTDDSPKNLLPTRVNIQEQIAKIRDKLSQSDLLVVAFSGHGVTIDYPDERGACPFFCVRDTDLPDIDTLLSRNWVFEQIDKCKADRKIFFCDACRTLYTTQKLIQLASRSGQSASIRSLEDPSETWGYNYVLISSCAKGQNSIDTGSNGLFTSDLLEGLRTSAAASRDGDLTAFSWFEYAAKKTEIASEQMIRDNPKLIIGAEKQTQQNPRIECRGEMSRFVIAKLDRAGLEVALPQDVEDVKVREYRVGSLKVRLQSSGSTLSGEKILAGKIQLPSIPVKISELTGEIRGIKDALTRMENGTHEAIREAERVKTAAQAQYEAIKMRRDEAWKQLPPGVQYNLEQRIKESPTAAPTTFASFKPKDVSFSQFIKLVLWGQKTEQARLEQLRVDSALKIEIQKEINRIKVDIADKTKTLDLETRKFRQALIQYLLEQTPGWNKPNVDEKMDYMFLSETIPALLKYPFGWNEESLYSIAEALWKERRPCAKREKERAERLERERQERLERERIAREKAERERIARAEARKHDFSIPGTKVGERKTVTVNGVEIAFRWCPPGTFMMGSPTSEEGRDRDEKQHQVTLTKGFWMMETEVTVGMFKAFVNDTGYESQGKTPYIWTGSDYERNSKYSWRNPGFGQNDNHPVTCVSWDDAVAFCKWLSKKTGLNITLPTEAQWEYACRAGTTGTYAGSLDAMAWYYSNSGSITHSVGTKNPNAWGLYDMYGNVSEWSQDWEDDYQGWSVTDPTGPSSGFQHVFRGGSWITGAKYCRSAEREYGVPVARADFLGFRCVKVQ